jgi:Leucine-rich repeat (LRR) protein
MSIVFPDSALDAAVRIAVGVPLPTPIEQSDLDLVTSFGTGMGSGIADLTGMEYWTALTELLIVDTSVSDISPLSTLTNITQLQLYMNDIVDMSPLAGLVNLTDLALCINSIVDISDISNFTLLSGMLMLSENSIVDITAIGSLTSLVMIGLGDNNISDISALASITSVEGLDLSNNQIQDISPLIGLLAATNEVYITGNPLNVLAYSTYIPALQGAGVTVAFDAEPTPTVISITPNSGTTAGGTPVTIAGTNFLDGATVTIDGVPCTSVVFVSDIELTAITPAGTTGAKDVVVTNDAEIGTLAGGFTYGAPGVSSGAGAFLARRETWVGGF